MQIKKYNPKNQTTPGENEFRFYIQSVGENSGRPLREPIPNSWEVITKREIDFQILYIVFESRILESFWRGSVITFISLNDYKNIIFPILKSAIHENNIINQHYLQIEKIENQINHQQKIKTLLQELKKTTARKVFNDFKKSELI